MYIAFPPKINAFDAPKRQYYTFFSLLRNPLAFYIGKLGKSQLALLFALSRLLIASQISSNGLTCDCDGFTINTSFLSSSLILGVDSGVKLSSFYWCRYNLTRDFLPSSKSAL